MSGIITEDWDITTELWYDLLTDSFKLKVRAWDKKELKKHGVIYSIVPEESPTIEEGAEYPVRLAR